MKHLIIAFSFLFAVCVNAQTTTPRTGTGTNNDNTFRAMTIKYKAVADTAGNDTVKLNLNAFKSLIPVALTDSVSINFTPVTNCYLGDQVQLLITNTSGAGKVKFVGSNYEVASDSTYGGATIAVASSKRAQIVFTFDGVKWVETSRITQ